MNDRVVQRKAREYARDEANERELSDPEWECLHDLLKRDEAFRYLVSAQYNAVAISTDDHPVAEETVELARKGAVHLGDARDRVIDRRVEEAREIVAIAQAVERPAPWGVMIDIYRSGLTSIEGLRETDRDTIVAETGTPPKLVEEIKTKLGEQEVSAE